MTREEAKELLPVFKAFAEGKTIQMFYRNEWITLREFNFDKSPKIYRIKPEPKYRPFKNKEECWQEMLKHQPIGYIKGKVQKNVVFITEISTNTHNELSFSLSISTSVYDAECLFSSYTFADGTPFGIQED